MGKKEDDHNRGQEDGAKSDVFDQFAQFINPFSSEHYDKGFRHGVDTTLEKDPISEFIFSGWSDRSKTEESREEVTSNDSQYDDNYYDDDDDDYYGYSPAYSFQAAPEEPEPEPKPEPIVHTTYSRTATGLSVSRTTYTFETEEEKAKHLRQEALLIEMLGDDVIEEKEDQEQLARIFEKIESDSVFDLITAAITLALMKEKK